MTTRRARGGLRDSDFSVSPVGWEVRARAPRGCARAQGGCCARGCRRMRSPRLCRAILASRGKVVRHSAHSSLKPYTGTAARFGIRGLTRPPKSRISPRGVQLRSQPPATWAPHTPGVRPALWLPLRAPLLVPRGEEPAVVPRHDQVGEIVALVCRRRRAAAAPPLPRLAWRRSRRRRPRRGRLRATPRRRPGAWRRPPRRCRSSAPRPGGGAARAGKAAAAARSGKRGRAKRRMRAASARARGRGRRRGPPRAG
mmetsp:Transcript_4413/g.14297  ORF Transcript_4413/g.14297 Transcript_4413/m.14297 type:complete len:255 (-) Transcript_4413:13-777(-)